MAAKKNTSHGRALSKRSANTAWKPNKTALITGASGGLGYDLASVFAENGYNVVLVARNKEKLLDLANRARQMFGVSAHVISKDLARPPAPAEIFKELQTKKINIDVLVNNAGYGLLGPFGYSDSSDQVNMLNVNVMAPIRLTTLFLPAMLLKGSGRILNIASTAGFQPGPFMSGYYASKAFVVSFTVGLAEELRDRGVTVSVLCPGPMATGFRTRAGIKQPALIASLADIDSRVVARNGFEGLMAGKVIIVPGTLNKLGTLAGRVLPMTMMARILGRVQKQRME
ncbi:MAG: SDR family oxidoreductase [Bacteroidota bacterium]